MSKKTTEAVYPLSPAQQGMLFHTLYEPQAGMYFQQMSTTLRGALDVAAFRAAWQQVLDRHAALRTVFAWERGEQPLQIVRLDVTLPWHEHDWRDRSAADQAEQLETLLEADRARGFNLHKAPLMRLTLIRLAEAEYHLTWSFHHLVLDGWSLPLIFRDVFVLYETLRQGRSAALPRPRPYRDYIGWLQRQDRAAAERFWRQHLAGKIAPTPLGIDRQARPGVTVAAAGEQLRAFSPALTADLQALARRAQVTLNTIVQAAWALLLSRYSGERDVLFGITVAGRPSELPGVEEMIGMFINTVPIRIAVPPAATLSDWLQQLQASQAELRQYDWSALVEIQGWSEIPRGQPLFESLFVFENYPTAASADQQPGALHSDATRTFERTNYPLTIIAAPGEQLSLRIGYDADRFDDLSIERLFGHFEALLSAMVRQPDQRLSTLSPLSQAEHSQLAAWNSAQQPAPQYASMTAYLQAQARRTPDAVAVIDGARRVSYRELNAQANQLAHQLQALGLGQDAGREPLVGVYLPRSLELVVALVAILKAGGAYVPLDPTYPAERLALILADSRAGLIITDQGLEATLPAHAATVVNIDRDAAAIAVQSSVEPEALHDSTRLAYLIYTSGSTGRPKGVAITHSSATTFIEWGRATYTDDELRGVLFGTSVCFDLSVFELFVTLSWGGSVIVAPNTLYLPTLPAADEVTLINTVPSAIAELVRSGGVPASVQTVNLAGEPLPAQLVEAIYRETNVRQLYNLYGPSEDTTYSTGMVMPRTFDGAPSIGRPLPNSQVYLVDAQLELVPLGVAGELLIGGDGLARGYLDRPALTAEKFIANPFAQGAPDQPGARLYRTGDLARWRNDGTLEFLGRIDHQIKLRGFRIELGEIETVLGKHPVVAEAVVLLREDHPDDKRLVAYVVAKEQRTENQEPTGEAPGSQFSVLGSHELSEFLKTRLPAYMVPSAFVLLPELPLTPNGKVDRKALPAPESAAADERQVDAPRGPIEEVLATIWSEVLGVEQIGRDDSFFVLGGHSLLAIQIVTRVRAAFKVDLPLHHVFQSSTLAALAAQIDQLLRAADGTQTPPLLRAARDGALPLSFAQQRLWFLDQLDPGNPSYTIPFAVRLSGALDVIALQRSLHEIVRRHEVLRTTFDLVADRAVQVIAASQDLPLTLIDLSAHPAAQRDEQLQQTILHWTRQPFDLQHGPLIRAGLVRLAEDLHVAVVTLHHSIADGWSLGVLVRELGTLYAALSTSAVDPTTVLPELPVQYADYAAWQRDYLRGEVLEQQLSYWRQQLADAPDLLALPTDRTRVSHQSDAAELLRRVTSPELSAQLIALSRREGVTLFMLGLAAWQTLFQRYSGQQDIVVGTPIAGRSQAETEPLIGCFINMLALRTSFAGQPTFRELLGRVRETALGAYAHQELPFEQLVEALQPSRDLSHTPIFQVIFTLQNTLMPSVALPGLRLEQLSPDTSAEQYDLSIGLDDSEPEQGLRWSIKYRTELFDAATIARMLDHLHTLLAVVVAQPERRVADLPLSDAAEQTLLAAWNSAQQPAPQHASMTAYLQEQARRTPEAVAVIDGARRVSYRELNARANQLAHQLQALGLGQDARREPLVGVYLPRSLELVVALVAILKAGGAYVPLDPTYPAERLALILADSRAGLIITDQGLEATLPAHAATVVNIDADAAAIAAQPASDPAPVQDSTRLAYLIYTSGSTGRPKGVAITHSSAITFIEWGRAAYTDDELRGVLFATSICFDLSVFELFVPLSWGGSVIVALNALYLPTLPAADEVTLINTVPSAMAELVRSGGVPATVQTVNLAGEPLTARLAEAIYRETGVARLYNLYGPSEDTTYSTYTLIDRDDPRAPSIGRPLPNSQVYLVDAQLRPVPLGVAGELLLGGDGLARGYLDRPALTAEKFIANPFSDLPGARLYRTGDLARWRNDGTLEFLGRIDHQIKLRGFRIELGEIEAALLRHSALRDAVVLLREDNPDDKRLVAYVVAKEPRTENQEPGSGTDGSEFLVLGSHELREFLKTRLPEYMVPSAFVLLPELPLTPNGKLDRKRLPAPDWTQGQRDKPYVAPRTPLEQELAALWSDLLGVEQVGIYDNFFTLGGHSLLLTQLASRIRTSFQVDIALRTLFNIPTIEEMTLAIAAAHVEHQDVAAVDDLLAELGELDAETIAALLAAEEQSGD